MCAIDPEPLAERYRTVSEKAPRQIETEDEDEPERYNPYGRDGFSDNWVSGSREPDPREKLERIRNAKK